MNSCEIAEICMTLVRKAFAECGVSARHLQGSTGYGYTDEGRDVLDAVFARALGADTALVRHNFVSGTHAIATALFACARRGQTVYFVTGEPYNTLKGVLYGSHAGSHGGTGSPCGGLADGGVDVRISNITAADFKDLSGFVRRSYAEISKADVVYFQRSRGYSFRPSLTAEAVAEACAAVRGINSDAVIICDNCYGEFVNSREPVTGTRDGKFSDGADIIVGSLIKNPGGGIASGGGYIAGREDLVVKCAERLTAPSLGGHVGSTPENLRRDMFRGLYFAPEIVYNAVRIGDRARELAARYGFSVSPELHEERGCIVTALRLGSREKLCRFCETIQAHSPVDSTAVPVPAPMPGYDCDVIMAAGTFTEGSSIELSADAPLLPENEEQIVYLQGGVSYYAGVAAVSAAFEAVL